MPRKLNSFMIRWWHDDDAERLELEHVQSGRKELSSSLKDAFTWMKAQQRASDVDEDRFDDDESDR